ncbi:MAG TPA: TIGR03557 family F420-dependent LLM class oxidoreductase [Solirubrobacteraceae bacterium]|nr:TIGR03557 family F420-dependent LLM class oxidoreductase [Solirubrobacteraceae bacterium]
MSPASLAVGLHLSAEEHPPGLLVDTARRAEEAGFGFLTISDHFHPWTRRQGQSPFVWTVLGAIAQVIERIPVGTAVTCPTIRTHPAIVAHAAATAAAMMPGRFFLGVGTGERLNEAVHGDRWPSAPVRREMLEEAVDVMRALWSGDVVRAHHGRHYTVEHARLYTLPEQPPPVVVSGFGPHAAELAGRIGDGYMHVAPEAELIETFRAAGGAGKPAYGKLDTCVAASDAEARRIAHETWPTTALQGELGQELATPEHYEQATANVTEEQVAEAILCSSDAQAHIEALGEFAAAGFDHVTVQQCGRDQERLIALYGAEVLPEVTAPTGRPQA